MRTLAQSCPNIEELNLSQCKKISDATCAALSSHCPKLQRLNLDSCPEITDISLKDLSDGCPLLTHINLSWCELLTDNGVEALARGCPELRSFLSKGCRQLTDRAVKCLARYCPNLEAINLHECRVLISLTPQIRVTPRQGGRREGGGGRERGTIAACLRTAVRLRLSFAVASPCRICRRREISLLRLSLREIRRDAQCAYLFPSSVL